MKLVYETTNYSAFQRLPGQRQVSEKHVNQIKQSIIENGYICDPIRVTQNMEVFDGQHRLEALKILGLPVEYIVLTELTTADAVRISNNTQMKWLMKDYVDSYADTGYKSYELIKNLAETYKVNIKTVLRAGNKTGEVAGKNEEFKKGVSDFGESDFVIANQKLPKYIEMKKAFRKHRVSGGCFDGAIFFLIENGYDIDKLIISEESMGDPSVRFTDVMTILNYMEKIHNTCRPKRMHIYPTEDYKKSAHYKVWTKRSA